MTTKKEYLDRIKDSIQEIKDIIDNDDNVNLLLKKDIWSFQYDLDLRVMELKSTLDDRKPYR